MDGGLQLGDGLEDAAADASSARDAAAAVLAKIAGKPGDAPEAVGSADPFMFQDYYAERTPLQIAKEFGPEFAKAMLELKPGAWQGPVRSGYGWHLVFVNAMEPGRVPAFEEVEHDVKTQWLDQKQREIKRTGFEAIVRAIRWSSHPSTPRISRAS